METTSHVAIKIGFKGEFRRVNIDSKNFTCTELTNLFSETFNIAPPTFVIQYKDQESDTVIVKSDADVADAVDYFTSIGAKCVRFVAVPATNPFQQNVAEPLVKVIEQLVQTLNEAIEKVKHEEWVAKARENAQALAAKAQENAGEWASKAQVNAGEWSVKAQETMQTTGAVLNETFSHTGEVLSETIANTSVVVNEKLAEAGATLGPYATKTVEESKAAFEAAKKGLNEIDFDKIKQSINEIEFERIMKEATEGMKSAAVVATSYAQNLVSELQKLQEHTVSIPVAEPVAVAVEAPAAPVETEEATVFVEAIPEVAAEAEWEQVQDESVVPTPSPEEVKWGAQLTLIREVFPSVDATIAANLLETANGDVHVVLNQLVEM